MGRPKKRTQPVRRRAGASSSRIDSSFFFLFFSYQKFFFFRFLRSIFGLCAAAICRHPQRDSIDIRDCVVAHHGSCIDSTRGLAGPSRQLLHQKDAEPCTWTLRTRGTIHAFAGIKPDMDSSRPGVNSAFCEYFFFP